jgi:hypothetical protein
MNFDSYHISSTILKLLPNSRKPVETKEINKSKAKGSNQVIDLIKKLSDLYESGILTEDEFSNKRKNYFLKYNKNNNSYKKRRVLTLLFFI